MLIFKRMILLLLLTCPAFGEKETFDFVIDQQGRQLPAHIFGFADPKMYEIHNDRAKNYNDDELLKLKKEIHLQHIRGPGGTVANYFLWKTGTVMNSTVPEYKKYYGEKTIGMIELTDPNVLKPLTMDLLLKNAQALKVPYVYALNIFSQTDEEIIECVIELKKSLPDQQLYLELGNETYAQINSHKFPTVKEYLDTAKRLSIKIKSVMPNAKIGVVAFQPVLYHRIAGSTGAKEKILSKNDWEYTQAGRILNWNSSILEYISFFDAIVLHPYLRIRTFSDKPNASDAMKHMFAEIEFHNEKLMELRDEFPDTEFWVTEWHIFNSPYLWGKTEKIKAIHSINKYSGSAIIIADMQSTLFFNPSITLSSIHSFYTANGFGMVNYLTPKDDDIKVKMPQYYTLQALGLILEKYKFVYSLHAPEGNKVSHKLAGLKKTVQYPKIGAYGYGTEKGAKLGVLINRTEHTQTFSITGKKIRKIWAYGDKTPFPNYLKEKKYAWVDAPDYIPAPRSFSEEFSKQIELEPYAMTIIEIDKATGLSFPTKK